MLNGIVAAPRPQPAEGPPSRRAFASALSPERRATQLAPTTLTVTLAAAPICVAVAIGRTSLSTPFLLLCLISAAAVGWVVDDPVEQQMTPLPISTPRRRLLRLVCVSVVALAGLVTGSVIAVIGPGLPEDHWDRVPEMAAAASISLALGLVAVRRGERHAGPMAVSAGLLVTVVVSALAVRWPTIVPSFNSGPTHTRWWWIAAVALAVAVHAGRDPGRR